MIPLQPPAHLKKIHQAPELDKDDGMKNPGASVAMHAVLSPAATHILPPGFS